ncbi:MAG: aspartate kinase [Faecousia sp.]
MIVAKFGGTSLADADRFRHAAQIIQADPGRRYVVVSAPGKRFESDIKVTDLLYRFQRSGAEADFEPIEARFQQIVEDLGIQLDLSGDFAEMKQLPHNADYMASCGEYLSARIMAAYLGWPFVDAEECVFFDAQGNLDEIKTRHALFERLRRLPHAVLPGYYGVTPDGQIHTFSRGGSDISGALVASAMDAQVYENWTDVDGMLVTDPRIVPQAAPIRSITYPELRELAYRGATVLHEDSVLPVRRSGIPIHICNTFRPQAPGSWIVARADSPAAPLTGIAGRRNYSAIQIERENTNSIVGYVRRILSCLEKWNVPFEHLATGLGSVCLVVPTAAIADCREQLQEDITLAVHPDSILIEDGLAMIAVVGRGMANKPGICARLFSSLGRSGISIRVIDQGSSEMNIVIGVSEPDFEPAIRAIHREFFE